MFRQQKLGEEERSNRAEGGEQKNNSEKMEVVEENLNKVPSKSVVEAASSSTPPKAGTEQVETCSKSPRPDVVSSTLNVSSHSPKDRQLTKSMAMLTQIFPGKSHKILEIKLREARGDVVKALEACAKHFDNVEQKQQSSHHHGKFLRIYNGILNEDTIL